MMEQTDHENQPSLAERYRRLAREMAERDYESAMYHRYEAGLKAGFAKGFVAGFAKGFADGKTKHQRIVARNMLKLGWSEDIIAKACEISNAEVRKIREQLD